MLNGSAGGSLPAPEPSASVGAKAGWRRRAEPSAIPGDAPKRPLPPGDAPKRTGARPRDGGSGDGGIGRPRGASRPAGDTPRSIGGATPPPNPTGGGGGVYGSCAGDGGSCTTTGFGFTTTAPPSGGSGACTRESGHDRSASAAAARPAAAAAAGAAAGRGRVRL